MSDSMTISAEQNTLIKFFGSFLMGGKSHFSPIQVLLGWIKMMKLKHWVWENTLAILTLSSLILNGFNFMFDPARDTIIIVTGLTF